MADSEGNVVTLGKATFAVVLLLLARLVHAGNPYVTLNLKGMPLSEAVNAIATQAGITVGISPEIASRLGPNVRLDAVPVSLAVELVATAYQVCVKRWETHISFFPCRVSREIYQSTVRPPPNYASERSVTALSERAAGARPAQRGR